MNKLSTKKFFINKIRSGDIKHITIYGSSMLPTFSSGETIEITKDIEIKTGNIVVAINNKSDNFVVHRIVDINNSNKEVCLLGDNQTNSEKCWLPISSLIAQAKEHAHLNKKNLNFNLVCDIPFNKPKYFNEPTYQVFQSLKMKDYDSYYFDYNIQFNLKLYDEEKVQDYKNCSKIEFNNFMNYFKLVRDIAARKYNLYKFTFGELVLCNPAESEEIKHIIDNYKETIYYSFYKEKIIKLKNFIKTKNKNFKPVKVYLVVNNFNKLISSIIFAKTCNEILSIKPILVNKSPIFDGRFDTRYYEQFFLKIISIAEINKDINNLNSDYSQINFDDYITPFKIAPITIREECYYKKCLFCDRHCKDNFSFNLKNIVDKISNLTKRGINNFVFEDDCIIPGEMNNIINALKAVGISIKWQGVFRFDKALNNEAILKNFSDNGCKFLFFGLETFSPKLLKKMNKGIDLKDAINVLKLCKQYSINTSVSLLFNFTQESLDDVKQTYEGVQNYIDLIDNFEINFFTPTKNCKVCYDTKGINYLCHSRKISKQKQEYIQKILNLIKEKHKLDSFYLKNYESWS